MTLHELIRKGNLEEVRSRLAVNAEEIFAKEGAMGLTPLHVAVQFGNPQIFALLLNSNPKIVNIPDVLGDTALQYAVNREDGEYFIRELCEKDADLNRFNDCSETCLYNSIFQAIEDENNNGIKDFHKTKILLEFGADCHVVCSGDTLFDVIAEKNLSMDWWTLLLDFGAGICMDFSKTTVDVVFLRKMTANQIVIGAMKDGKPIDRSTPGFEDAHTNEEELKKAISDGNRYNFKALIASTKHLLKYNAQNPALITQLNKLIELFEAYRIKNMQSTGIDQLLRNFLLTPNLAAVKDKLPSDIRETFEEREKQVAQQFFRGGFV